MNVFVFFYFAIFYKLITNLYLFFGPSLFFHILFKRNQEYFDMSHLLVYQDVDEYRVVAPLV